MPNSFGSLMELREGDKWALSIVEVFPSTLTSGRYYYGSQGSAPKW